MPEQRSQAEVGAKDSVERALQQARTTFTRMSAELRLGEVTWDGQGSTFELGGHTVRARRPEGGSAVFLGRDGQDTYYACISPGVFRSDSGTIVIDFTPLVRREVEALVREVEA